MQSIRRSLPPSRHAITALLRADATVQLRQRASVIMGLVIPLFFLFAWRNLATALGSTGLIAGCISVGLPSIGVMGYALVMARDLELGVFRRLRITPCPAWIIMSSRWFVQLSIMIGMALITVVASRLVDGIKIGPASIFKLLLAVLISGPLFLSLGQLAVALFQGTEAVGSATRMIYIAILVMGILATTLNKDSPWLLVAEWSPVGVARAVMVNALASGTLGWQAVYSVLAAITYTVVFASIGIVRFRWTINK